MLHSQSVGTHLAKKIANVLFVCCSSEVRDEQRGSGTDLHFDSVLLEKFLVTGLRPKSLIFCFELDDGNFRIPILSMEHLDTVNSATLSKNQYTREVHGS